MLKVGIHIGLMSVILYGAEIGFLILVECRSKQHNIMFVINAVSGLRP